MNNKKSGPPVCYDFNRNRKSTRDRIDLNIKALVRLLARRAAEADYLKALQDAGEPAATGHNEEKDDS
tara:strand:+ start:494 stop:697 length:204 start_codon:yes stop_codon:yes gene_type:complete